MPEASTALPANDPRDSRSRLLVWAWWVVFGGLLLAILALAVYLALRKPETVYRTLPPPPPDAQQQSALDQARAKGEGAQRGNRRPQGRARGLYLPARNRQGSGGAGHPGPARRQ